MEKEIIRKISFSCEETNCTKTFKTKIRLNKHNHNDHTLQLTVLVQKSKSPEYIYILLYQSSQFVASYTVDKTEIGFIYPKYNNDLKPTSTFKAYAERYNKLPKTKKKKSDESNSTSPPIAKLPEAHQMI